MSILSSALLAHLHSFFFAHFHILNCTPPDFAPNFSNKNYGEYGYREWYDYHVFYTGSLTKEMTYKNHHDRITTMHMKNNIDITKKTHAGHHYAAQTACAHGASVNGTKALGSWSDNGSFNLVYDRAFPLDALLGAGMFNVLLGAVSQTPPKTPNLPLQFL
ncbi:hypothetical protein BD769DRAFT_1678376 [Suillus cothurnatus]|nr:hypothetical protein BD769DRAFT_1678376 [Suillus cothurnatus]